MNATLEVDDAQARPATWLLSRPAEGDGEASKDERASMGARRRCRPSRAAQEGCTLHLLEQRPLAFRREGACEFEFEGKGHGHSLSGRSDTSEPACVPSTSRVPMAMQYTDRYVYYVP